MILLFYLIDMEAVNSFGIWRSIARAASWNSSFHLFFFSFDCFAFNLLEKNSAPALFLWRSSTSIIASTSNVLSNHLAEIQFAERTEQLTAARFWRCLKLTVKIDTQKEQLQQCSSEMDDGMKWWITWTWPLFFGYEWRKCILISCT